MAENLFPRITPQDLEDKTLKRLNDVITDAMQHVSDAHDKTDALAKEIKKQGDQLGVLNDQRVSAFVDTSGTVDVSNLTVVSTGWTAAAPATERNVQITCSYSVPIAPTGLIFTGVEAWLETPIDGALYEQGWQFYYAPGDEVFTLVLPEPTAPDTWKVYALARYERLSNAERVDRSLQLSTSAHPTPYVSIPVPIEPPGEIGIDWSPVVINADAWVNYPQEIDGSDGSIRQGQFHSFEGTWEIPAGDEYSGIQVVRIKNPDPAVTTVLTAAADQYAKSLQVAATTAGFPADAPFYIQIGNDVRYVTSVVINGGNKTWSFAHRLSEAQLNGATVNYLEGDVLAIEAEGSVRFRTDPWDLPVTVPQDYDIYFQGFGYSVAGGTWETNTRLNAIQAAGTNATPKITVTVVDPAATVPQVQYFRVGTKPTGYVRSTLVAAVYTAGADWDNAPYLDSQNETLNFDWECFLPSSTYFGLWASFSIYIKSGTDYVQVTGPMDKWMSDNPDHDGYVWDTVRINRKDLPETDTDWEFIACSVNIFGTEDRVGGNPDGPGPISPNTGTNYPTFTVGPNPPPPSTAAAPGFITNIRKQSDGDPGVDYDYDDPDWVHIAGLADLPSTLNDFNGCRIWISVGAAETDGDLYDQGEAPHVQGESGPFSFSLNVFRPTANQTWWLWFASKNAIITADIVRSGGGISPNVSISVTARPSSVATPPSDISNIVKQSDHSAGVDVDYPDATTVNIKGEFDLPTTLNDFNGCEVWRSIGAAETDGVPIKATRIWHTPGDSGPVLFDFDLSRPASAETWHLWFVSRNNQTENTLNRTAPSKTPVVSFSVTARPTDPTAADPPGNVTLGTPTVSYPVRTDSNGNRVAQISIPFTRPDPQGTFDRMEVYLQAPDSFADTAPAMVGGDFIGWTIASALYAAKIVANTHPEDKGLWMYDSDHPVIVFQHPAPFAAEKWRIWVVSASPIVTNSILDSPNVVVDVTAPPADVSGVEYAPLVTNFELFDPETDATATGPFYGFQAGGDDLWGFAVRWQNNTGDFRWPFYGGVDIIIEYPDGRQELNASVSSNILAQVNKNWAVDSVPVTFKVWAVSWEASRQNRRNSIVPGVTPMVEFTVEPQVGPANQEYADLVTGFAVSNDGYGVNGAGQKALNFTATWTRPVSDPRFGGIVILLERGGDIYQFTGIEAGSEKTLEILDLPAASESITFWAVSCNTNNKLNGNGIPVNGTTPKVTLTIDPPAIDVAAVTGFSVSTAYRNNSDGQRVIVYTPTFTPPADPQWAGVRIVQEIEGSSDKLLGEVSASGDEIERSDFPTATIQVAYKAYSIDVNGQTISTAVRSPGSGYGALNPPDNTALPDVTGFSVAWSYKNNADGQRVLQMIPTFTKPSDSRWGWIIFSLERQGLGEWELGYPDTSGQVGAAFLNDFPTTSENWCWYAESVDVNGKRKGSRVRYPVTPGTYTTVTPPVDGSAGQEKCAMVTGVTGSIVYSTSVDGLEIFAWIGSWTKPSDPRFAGINVYRRKQSDGSLVKVSESLETGTTFQSRFEPLITGSTYDLYFISSDVNGRENTLAVGTSPRVLNLTPTAQTTGAVVGSRVKNIPAASFASTLRVPELVTSLPTLPDASYPQGALVTLTTDGAAKLYRSTGTAWTKTLDGADLLANTVYAGAVVAGAIGTRELSVTEILLGAGGGKPPRLKVVDAVGSMLAFIGDDGAGFVGIYGQKLRIAPSLGASQRIEANAAGVSIQNVPFGMNLNNVTTAIDGNAMSVLGFSIPGVSVTKNNTVLRSVMVPFGFVTYAETGLGGASLHVINGYGQMVLSNAAGAGTIQMLASTGNISCTSLTATSCNPSSLTAGQMIWTPYDGVTWLDSNLSIGQMAWVKSSNSVVYIKFRGSDGIVRTSTAVFT